MILHNLEITLDKLGGIRVEYGKMSNRTNIDKINDYYNLFMHLIKNENMYELVNFTFNKDLKVKTKAISILPDAYTSIFDRFNEKQINMNYIFHKNKEYKFIIVNERKVYWYDIMWFSTDNNNFINLIRGTMNAKSTANLETNT